MREVYHADVLAQRLLTVMREAIRERAMGAADNVRTLEIDNSWSHAFAHGFTDGQAARDRNQSLTAYVRVGIDDYAKGFRQGFFNRTSLSARNSRPVSRQFANR